MLVALLLVTVTVLAGCGSSSTRSSPSPTGTSSVQSGSSSTGASPPTQQTSGRSEPPPAATILVGIPTLLPKSHIPKRYTCDGGDIPLPVQWSHIPSGTAKLAMLVVNLEPVEGRLLGRLGCRGPQVRRRTGSPPGGLPRAPSSAATASATWATRSARPGHGRRTLHRKGGRAAPPTCRQVGLRCGNAVPGSQTVGQDRWGRRRDLHTVINPEQGADFNPAPGRHCVLAESEPGPSTTQGACQNESASNKDPGREPAGRVRVECAHGLGSVGVGRP